MNAVLQMIDAYDRRSLIIAATNHERRYAGPYDG